MSVSVIIPAYNVAQVISRAIASAVNQTLPALEIIVVDDASTDGLQDVLRELAKTNLQIKLLLLDKNCGPSRARNIGIAAARGEWIAILDADDAWKPERLEQLVKIGQSHGADFVADNQILYDAVAEKEGRVGFVVDWAFKTLNVERLFLNDILDTSQPAYPPLKPIIRRAFLQDTGVTYDENARYGEDFKFYAELLFRGAKALLTSQAYYIYSTRVGEFSGKSSPVSQSNPRFDLLIVMSDELKSKYRNSITPSIAVAMERRRVQLRLIHLANVARGFRRSGDHMKYAMYLFRHPELIPFLFKRVARKLSQKT